jgi:uncharacterized membrane protein
MIKNIQVRTVCAILLLVLLSAVTVSAGTFSYEVSANGEVVADLEFTESGALNLPEDAAIQDILGITLDPRPDGVAVTVTSQPATLSYTSSHHTRKERGIWYFTATTSHDSQVSLSLPGNVKVVTSVGHASITGGDTLTLEWENVTDISASYIFIGEPSVITPPRSSQLPLLVSILILLVVVSVVSFIRFKVKPKTKPKKADEEKPNITDGQMNVIRAANINEAKIMELLLKHNGHMKRNKLEKHSQLSKSSLASSLNNLEKKNIVTVDRTFHVHYVKLTQWFTDLS